MGSNPIRATAFLSKLAFVCVTSGVRQAPSTRPPERCPICEDERQYVRQGGQEVIGAEPTL